MVGILKLEGDLCSSRLKDMEASLSVMTDSVLFIKERYSSVRSFWEGEAASKWSNEMGKALDDVEKVFEEVRKLAMKADILARELADAKELVDETVNGFGMWLI